MYKYFIVQKSNELFYMDHDNEVIYQYKSEYKDPLWELVIYVYSTWVEETDTETYAFYRFDADSHDHAVGIFRILEEGQ